MTEVKVRFDPGPSMLSDPEKVVAEQFAEATKHVKEMAQEALGLMKIMNDAGVEPTKQTAMALLAMAVGALRADGVSPRLVMEAVGAIVTATISKDIGLRTGGLYETLEEIGPNRRQNIEALIKAKEEGRMVLDMPETVKACPLSLVVVWEKEHGQSEHSMSAVVSYHPDAFDHDDEPPVTTFYQCVKMGLKALNEALKSATDPKGAN